MFVRCQAKGGLERVKVKYKLLRTTITLDIFFKYVLGTVRIAYYCVYYVITHTKTATADSPTRNYNNKRRFASLRTSTVTERRHK